MKLNNLKSIKMKKFLFTIVATVLMSSSIFAQNVARECVLVEAFTGIGCVYCPAAAGGIAEMVKQGLNVAPLAFHNKAYSPSEYATTETNGRANFYNVLGFPTVVVDGVLRPGVAGPAMQYMQSYAALKAEYDKRINIESPFKIDLTFDYHSGTKCQAKAVVTKVGECSGDDVRVFIALAESHIPQAWGGWTELNAVVRDVVTSTAGAEFIGETTEVTGLFDITQYKKENCELVAWVQNVGTDKEVYQAVKVSIATEPAKYDVTVSKEEKAPNGNCSGKVQPSVTIKNNGSENLTSVVFKISDDLGNDLGSTTWNGNLQQNAEEVFEMPEIAFADASFVKYEAVELNGSFEDEYAFDNSFGYVVNPAYQLLDDGLLKFQIKTTDPQNFTVEVVNMDKNEVVKTLTFTDNKLVREDYYLPEEGCYRILFKNSKGNGCGENANWGVMNSKKKEIVSGKQGKNDFTYQYIFELTYGKSSVGVEEVVTENVEIYPNPAKNVVNINVNDLDKISVFNSIGQAVYVENVNSDEHAINVESWSNGLYYISLETKNGVISSQKIIINK